MNFFEHQERARKKTGQLVLLFGLAVLTIILMTTLLVALFFGFVDAEAVEQGMSRGLPVREIAAHFTSTNLFLVTVAVLAVVGGGSLYKLAQLSGGGSKVAELLGGQLLTHQSAKAHPERVLLNVVEEMAIASGSPVPAVYVMHGERDINAFAAGFSPSDAVIGITEGALYQLNREELQGVIAHEFSHIFNGDMKLNMRLMGVLHGILLIGIIGYHLLDSVRFGGGGRKKDGHIGFIALAIGLMAIGYGGVFFGNLIKAAVSRQREFLADASAVQFTRNPDGIGNALKKIGGMGSFVRAREVDQAAHMFFGAGAKRYFTGMFATHPPLDQRIKLIDRRWDGKYLTLKPDEPSPLAGVESGYSPARTVNVEPTYEVGREAGIAAAVTLAAAAEALVQRVGNPGVEELHQAQQLLANIPELWLKTAHHPGNAEAVIYALLVDGNEAEVTRQKQLIASFLPLSYALVDDLQSPANTLDPKYRLPVIDIAIASLKAATTRAERRKLLLNVKTLVEVDKRVTLFEWCLQALLQHQLQDKVAVKATHRSLKAVASACQVLFSALVTAGTSRDKRSAAFDAAAAMAQLPELTLLNDDKLSLSRFTAALAELNQLFPLVKPQLLKASLAALNADGVITVTEREMLRAVADTLDCPVPLQTS